METLTDTNPAAGARDRYVQIERVFDAPRELVFRAWASADALVRWYAPEGCTIRFEKLDFREGGTFHSCLRTPEGKDCWCRGIYREIAKPERIIFTMAIADGQGNYATPAEAGMDPEWPAETVVTVTFRELGGKTHFTLHQTVSEILAKRTGAYPGWLLMLDRLEALLNKNLV